jgi:hypothetical protein
MATHRRSLYKFITNILARLNCNGMTDFMKGVSYVYECMQALS